MHFKIACFPCLTLCISSCFQCFFMCRHLIFYIYFIIIIRRVSTVSCRYRMFLQMFYRFIYVHEYPNILRLSPFFVLGLCIPILLLVLHVHQISYEFNIDFFGNECSKHIRIISHIIVLYRCPPIITTLLSITYSWNTTCVIIF